MAYFPPSGTPAAPAATPAAPAATPAAPAATPADAFIDWVLGKGFPVGADFDSQVVEALNFHLLLPRVLDTDNFVGLKIDEDFDYQWSYSFEVTFLYGDYTMRALEMHPSSIISKVIDKIPFTEHDKIEKEDDGAGGSYNAEDYRCFEEFLDEDTHMDRIFPVLSGRHYYFLNVAQKAEYDRLVTAYTPVVHWSDGRKRVRGGIHPRPGNALLRTVEGLPRGAIAEIYMQLNTPSVVTRGGAGGE